MSQIEARHEAWRRGRLRYKLRSAQKEVYDQIRGTKPKGRHKYTPHVLLFHRRFGKTFLSLLLLFEEALREPNKRLKLITPSGKQGSDIVSDHLPVMLEDCPPDIEISTYKNNEIRFRSDRWGNAAHSKHILSKIQLGGVLRDNGDWMRGTKTDAAVLDEVRDFPDLSYTYGSVLMTSLKDSKNPFSLMITTPPRHLDHPFVSKYIPRAQEAERYVVIPGKDNPDWSEEDDLAFADELGGHESIEYRREIGCELIADAEHMILPEFAEADVGLAGGGYANRLVLPKSYEPPSHYIAFAVADLGGKKDSTGILYGACDFERQELCILGEDFYLDPHSDRLASIWSDGEARHFTEGAIEVRRWADVHNPQRIIDLSNDHNLHLRQVKKTERDPARNVCRSAIRQGKIKFHPRCVELMYQMRNGKRKPNGDFERSKRMGHCDLVAALIYMWRKVSDSKALEVNPFPSEILDRESTMILEQASPVWGQKASRRC